MVFSYEMFRLGSFLALFKRSSMGRLFRDTGRLKVGVTAFLL